MNPRRLQRETSFSRTVASGMGSSGSGSFQKMKRAGTGACPYESREHDSRGGGWGGPSRRGRGTGAGLGGSGGVELAGQPAPTAGGGVLVDRPLGRHLVQPLGDQPQLGFGLGCVPAAQGRRERLDLVLDRFLPRPVVRAAREVLADSLLGGQ